MTLMSAEKARRTVCSLAGGETCLVGFDEWLAVEDFGWYVRDIREHMLSPQRTVTFDALEHHIPDGREYNVNK
jgi:hypothetical protein